MPKTKKREQEHRFRLSRKLLIKMLVSCLLLTMLPLLLSSRLYRNQILENTAREEQTIAAYLDNRRNRYDEAVLELNKVLLSVLGDNELLSVSILENPLDNAGNQLYRFVQAQKQIGLISKPYDFLDQVILLNMRRDVAISSESTYLRMDLFAAAMEKKYHGYIWPKDMLSSLVAPGHPNQQWFYLSSATGEDAIAIYASTMFVSNGNHIVLSVITADKMDQYLRPDRDMDILIYNRDGQRLSAAPTCGLSDSQLLAVDDSAVLEAGNGERYFVKAADSNVSEHRLYAVTPYEPIESFINSMKATNRMYLMIFVICALLLCFLVTWINMKPLDGMMRFLFGQDSEKVTRAMNWKNIESRIHELFRKNDELTSDLQNQRESLTNLLLYELINNGKSSMEHTLRRLEQLDFPLEDEYTVLLLEIPRPSDTMEPSAFSLLMHRYIGFHFPQVAAVLDMSTRRYVALIPVGNEEVNTEEQFGKFCLEVQDALQVAPLGCSFRLNTIRELGPMYWNAVIEVEMHREDEPKLYPMTGESEGSWELSFPQRIEQEIITAIVTGSRERLENALNELYDLNNQDRMMSTVGARLLWERVSAVTVMALARTKNLPESLQLKTVLAARHMGEVENRYDFTHHLISSLDSVFILTERENGTGSGLRRSQLGGKIVDFIQLHLSDQELCLQLVADHFNLSSAYVSSLVKDETGQTFSVYCERLRIANACELLREGRQIQDVAEAVGYNSDHTFRRVFKKVVGILPSQYTGQQNG